MICFSWKLLIRLFFPGCCQFHSWKTNNRESNEKSIYSSKYAPLDWIHYCQRERSDEISPFTEVCSRKFEEHRNCTFFSLKSFASKKLFKHRNKWKSSGNIELCSRWERISYHTSSWRSIGLLWLTRTGLFDAKFYVAFPQLVATHSVSYRLSFRKKLSVLF